LSCFAFSRSSNGVLPLNDPEIIVADYASAETNTLSRAKWIVVHVVGILLALLWITFEVAKVPEIVATPAPVVNPPFNVPNPFQQPTPIVETRVVHSIFIVALSLTAAMMLYGCCAAIGRFPHGRRMVLTGGLGFAAVYLIATLLDLFSGSLPISPLLSILTCIDAADKWIYPILYYLLVPRA
jgi:hypothetical protein